ncbi:hypothetical protein [Bdellovibrio sp. HCB209]|uniref:hypothetical protein n=1 Tax=Bdellovibrio sp. HCB209 TaxID=3394354 RepID=UPI0039B3C6D7
MVHNRKLLLALPVLVALGFALMRSPSSNSASPIDTRTAQDTAKTPLAPTVAKTTEQAPLKNPTAVSPSIDVQFPSKLSTQVKSIVTSLSHPDLALTPEQLDVSKITPAERQQLKNAVLSQKVDGSTRRASLFLLTKMGSTAIPELGAVATTPVPVYANSNNPHSVARQAQDMEISLRITSLEALDKLAVQSKNILPIMQQAAALQSDRSLVLLARISISGMLSGKPGRLSRAMDAMMDEKNL